MTPKESGWGERFDEQFCRESSWPGGGLDLLEGNREEVIAFIAQVEATAIAATEARERARLREEVVKMPAFELDGDGGTLLRLADVLALLRD